MASVQTYISETYGNIRVRFRASSKTAALPGFTGAGLYTSISGQLENEERAIDDAIRTVWASLYLQRAYDERRYHRIDESQVAMGILIHPAFLSEKANGVVISRNILEPIRNQDYINVQIGEASVANPAPGVTTEQIVYDRVRDPNFTVLARSSLTRGEPILTESEVRRVSCLVNQIEAHFQALDPMKNPWLPSMLNSNWWGDRNIIIKQARPYSFGSTPVPEDCREL